MEFDIKTATPVDGQEEAIENEEFDINTATPVAGAEPIPIEEAQGSIAADIARVMMDTGENIAFLPATVANIISETTTGTKVVPDKFLDLARKESVNLFANPLRSLGFEETADKLYSSVLTEEGKVKDVETLTGDVASIVPYAIVGTKAYKELAEAGVKYGKGIIAGAATGVALGDVEDQNFTDIVVEMLPDIKGNVVVDFLSSQEEDTILKKKAVVALEESIIGGVIDVVIHTPKILKAFGVAGIESVKYVTQKSKQLYNKSVGELTPAEQADVMVEVLEEAKVTTQFKQQSQLTDIQLTETAEGSSQVALQQSSKLNRFMRRFFTSRGYFTPRGYNAFEDSQYAQRQTIAKAENIALRLQQSLDEMGESTDKEEVIETINKLFTEDLRWLKGTKQDKIIDLADKYNLTDVQAEEFLNARELIDDMSRELIGSTSVSDSLKETIQENVGEYIRRSYRLFEDAGYKPTAKVQKDAIDYIYNNLLDTNPNISESAALQQAVDTVDEILTQGNKSEFVDYFSNVKKINKDILKQQETIPLEIRRLMGEIEQPSENIILTVSKMTNLLNTTKFYDNLAELGHSGGYIFKEGQPRPQGYDSKITGTNSKLDGQYTTPEMLDEIKNNTSSFINGSKLQGYRNFLSLKGQAQKLKTVYSHITHIRNFTGGMQFGLANGSNPFGGEAKETLKVLIDSIAKGGDASLNNTYEKYLRLGIINTNVRANEFRAILEAGYESGVDQFTDKVADKLSKIGLNKNRREFFDNVYVATDDFYKINYFNQELKVLQQAYPDVAPEVLEEQAANIVRNTMPNYDRVPKGVKALKELPIGSFFSFPAEIIRTSSHIVRQAATEMASTNPTIRDRGLKRIAGFTVTTSGMTAMANMSANLAGFDEEQQKAISILSETPWSQTAPRNILNIDGKIYTNDTQYIDSYSPLKEPLRAAAFEWSKGEINEDEFNQKVLDSTLAFSYSFFKPYIEETILTSAITDVGLAAINADGRTPNGKEIFTPGLTVAEKTQNVFEHLGKTLIPGSFLSVKSLVDSSNEVPNRNTGKPKSFEAELVANMTGVKFTELDIESTLKYSIQDYNRQNALAISTGINFERDSTKIVDRYKNQQKVRLDAYKDLYRKAMAAEYILGEDEVYRLLLDNGLSRADLVYIDDGTFKPSKPPQKGFVAIQEKTPDVKTGERAEEVYTELMNVYFDLTEVKLNDPVAKPELDDNERLKKVMGGLVEELVPNAPENPSDRVNKLTGVPYNLEAGAAFLEETNPIRPLVMAEGGRVKKSTGGELAAKLVGIAEEDLEWAKSQDKRFDTKEKYDGKGDAARHLALGWITQRASNPELALKAANFRENLSLRRLDKPMDQHNNNLGATIKANNFKEAEIEIDRLIAEGKAMYMTPDESKKMRGYAKGGKVLTALKRNCK